MKQYTRIIIATLILLSGLVLLPRSSLLGGVVQWQQFAGGYGGDQYELKFPLVFYESYPADIDPGPLSE